MYWHGPLAGSLPRAPSRSIPGQVPADAFKLMKRRRRLLAGRQQEQACSSASTASPSANKADLKAHLTMLEEAAKRDHRRIGREMSLFHLQEEAPGMVFWHPNGWAVYRALEDYMRRRLDRRRVQRDQDPSGRRPRALGEAPGTGISTARTCSSPRSTRSMRQRRQAGQRAEADELPVPCAGLQPAGSRATATCRCASRSSASCHRYEARARCTA